MIHSKFRSAMCVFATGALIFCSFGFAFADDKKLTPEELIARHLDSLGSKEAIAAVKTRALIGSVKALNRLGNAGEIIGKAVMLSESPKLIYSMKFPSTQYPSEQMAFDGS